MVVIKKLQREKQCLTMGIRNWKSIPASKTRQSKRWSSKYSLISGRRAQRKVRCSAFQNKSCPHWQIDVIFFDSWHQRWHFTWGRYRFKCYNKQSWPHHLHVRIKWGSGHITTNLADRPLPLLYKWNCKRARCQPPWFAFGLGLDWVFGVEALSWWGLGSLYTHKRITLGKNFARRSDDQGFTHQLESRSMWLVLTAVGNTSFSHFTWYKYDTYNQSHSYVQCH